MAEQPGDAQVAALIQSLASRGGSETERLMSMLQRQSWPGGTLDRTQPAALEWVRRWGPARLTVTRVDCSCGQGRCSVCN